MHSMAPYVLMASAAILLWLGLLHVVYTFRGTRLVPRDTDLRHRMDSVSPVLTRQTTMWKAWVGFNFSHSFGAILFGLVYGYLALSEPGLLFGSPFLLAVGFALLAGYAVLAARYWFKQLFRYLVAAMVLYVIAAVLRFTGA